MGTPVVITPVEPGYLTTEFWATQVFSLFSAIILLLSVFNVIAWTDVQKGAVVGVLTVAIGIAQGLYALSRGLRKQGQ